MTNPRRKRGEKPRYWWDFQWKGDKIVAIVIETTDPRVVDGLVARLPYGRGSIEAADKYVKDLEEGRRNS